MHKPLNYNATWGKRKSLLLFALFFSFALMVVSLYLTISKSSWPNQELVSLPDRLGPIDPEHGWACLIMAIAIGLILGIFSYLLNRIRIQEKLVKQLKAQKEYYGAMINSIGEPLITTGKEGQILYMNPAAGKLIGLSFKEAQNLQLENIFKAVNQDAHKTFNSILSGILRKGETVRFENSIICPTANQQQLVLNSSGSPLFDNKGDISGSVWLFNDISKSKENEKKIAKNEIFSRGILDALNSHIAVVNSSGTIIKVNKAWKGFIAAKGATDLEKYYEGTNYFAICERLGNMEDGTCSKAQEGIKKVFDGTLNEFYLEYEYRANSPAEGKWFYMRAMKFESAETLVVIEHHDITKRKKAETKTLRAIEQYDILSKATSDTIWDWDIPHNEITYNEGITKMFGYKVSEIENAVDWWKMNIHPDDLPGVTEALSDVFKKGTENLQLEYRFRSASKSYKYIYDRAFVIYDERGGPTRIIGAMQDVTYEMEEEKRIAKAIIDGQEQERCYIGQELHDNVNQILAGSLLTVVMAKQKDANAERVAELINLCEEHLLDAIDEVRKLSHRLAPATFDEMSLKDIFEDLLVKINIDSQYKIAFCFDETISLLTSGDIQINLYRILQEQVKNILKYSGGNVIEVAVTLTGGIVRMRTFDNGKGFDLKTVKKGIGLSNIRKRVDSFSGKCIVNSAPGKGCEIIVEIPLSGAL